MQAYRNEPELSQHQHDAGRNSWGLILGLHPVNERRRYKVTRSLIGWVQT